MSFRFPNLPEDIVIHSFGQHLQHVSGTVGLQIWPAAVLLCHYLLSPPGKNSIMGHHVLELGSGTGLCAVVAARAPATQVIATDYDQKVLDLLEKNLKKNLSDQFRYEVAKLAWGCEEDLTELREKLFKACEKRSWQSIIASDVIYAREALEPLLKTVVNINV